MSRYDTIDEYFEWLYDLVCGQRFSKHISYRKLLMQLHDMEFTYLIPMDENRAADGEELRYRFARHRVHEDLVEEIVDELSGPCSVLEMMIALAVKCEEYFMDNPNYGDRTAQWFWGMINNLGLGSMTDDQFNKRRVVSAIEALLRREYAPDGRGGLFTVKHCEYDLREVEIWRQLCWYLNNILTF